MSQSSPFEGAQGIGANSAPYLVSRAFSYSSLRAVEQGNDQLVCGNDDAGNADDTEESLPGSTSQSDLCDEAEEILSEASMPEKHAESLEVTRMEARTSMTIPLDDALNCPAYSPHDAAHSANLEIRENVPHDACDKDALHYTDSLFHADITERPLQTSGTSNDNRDTNFSVDPLRAIASTGETDWTKFFPLTRVRDILRYESSSFNVSKEAATAGGEATVLFLRDMTKTAAVEAARNGRKTVTYDDVSRLTNLFDRFCFLCEVLPLASAPGNNSFNATQWLGEHRTVNQTHTRKRTVNAKMTGASVKKIYENTHKKTTLTKYIHS